MFITKMLLGSALMVLPLCAIASASPAAEESLAEDVADNVHETSIPSHFLPSCTDSGAADYSAKFVMADPVGEVSSISPNYTYGSDMCVGRYVVEATDTASISGLVASVQDEASSLSQASCSKGSVSMLVFGFVGVDGAGWVQIGGEHTATGVWNSASSGFPGTPAECVINLSINIPKGYSKVRVAAKATLQTAYGPAARKVGVNIYAFVAPR